MNPTLGALVRFWWIAAVGLAVGAVVAAVLIGREPSTIYTATENVLVTSPSSPYLRTAQTQVSVTTKPVHPATTKPVKHSAKAAKSPQKKPVVKAPVQSSVTTPPDTQVLVNAANLYPLLIQSDEIARLRVSLYGPTPGTVSASAIASSTNTYGVYHPSPLPVIQVKTTSRRPQAAKKLAVNTVRAFGVWIVQRQQASGIPASERITIEQLRVRVRGSGGVSYGLPLFAAVIVLLGFCGLAVVADRLRPRRSGALEDSTTARPHRRVA